MGSTLVGVQFSPIPHWVSFHAIGLALVYWANARVDAHRLSLRLPYLGVFPFTLPLFLFYGRRICTHSVNPSLTQFLSEFPGLGLALEPDVVVQEAEQRCAWSRHLHPNFCPGSSRKPWTLVSKAHALFLVASYDMQEDAAGQV